MSDFLIIYYFALSQDPPFKCWDTSCCPKTLRPSVGTLSAVPRLPTQVLGQSDLFFFGTVGSLFLWSWDSRIFCSLALGYLDLYPCYHHLSFSFKNFPQNPILLTKILLTSPLEVTLLMFINQMQIETPSPDASLNLY